MCLLQSLVFGLGVDVLVLAICRRLIDKGLNHQTALSVSLLTPPFVVVSSQLISGRLGRWVSHIRDETSVSCVIALAVPTNTLLDVHLNWMRFYLRQDEVIISIVCACQFFVTAAILRSAIEADGRIRVKPMCLGVLVIAQLLMNAVAVY